MAYASANQITKPTGATMRTHDRNNMFQLRRPYRPNPFQSFSCPFSSLLSSAAVALLGEQIVALVRGFSSGNLADISKGRTILS